MPHVVINEWHVLSNISKGWCGDGTVHISLIKFKELCRTHKCHSKEPLFVLAWIQTVHIESLCVSASFTDWIALEFIRACDRCESLNCEVVRHLQVDQDMTLECALRTEKAGDIVSVIVGVSED